MEVPIPYIRPMFQAYVREYPQNICPYMVLTYLHFRILKFPLIDLPRDFTTGDPTDPMVEAPLRRRGWRRGRPSWAADLAVDLMRHERCCGLMGSWC